MRIQKLYVSTSYLCAALFAFSGCAANSQTTSQLNQQRKDATLNPASREQKSKLNPEHLPLTARMMVRERMDSHGEEMSELLWAVMFFERALVVDIGQSILNEPRLSRPLSPDDASLLNASFPSSFFDYQEELVQQTKTLVQVARDESKSPEDLVQSFSALNATCVRCHAVYLYPQTPPMPEQ